MILLSAKSLAHFRKGETSTHLCINDEGRATTFRRLLHRLDDVRELARVVITVSREDLDRTVRQKVDLSALSIIPARKNRFSRVEQSCLPVSRVSEDVILALQRQ
jgi:hypothetical protein